MLQFISQNVPKKNLEPPMYREWMFQLNNPDNFIPATPISTIESNPTTLLLNFLDNKPSTPFMFRLWCPTGFNFQSTMQILVNCTDIDNTGLDAGSMIADGSISTNPASLKPLYQILTFRQNYYLGNSKHEPIFGVNMYWDFNIMPPTGTFTPYLLPWYTYLTIKLDQQTGFELDLGYIKLMQQ